MISKEVEDEIVKLYKEGNTFYNIYQKTGINGNSSASMLRRKHPALMRNSRDKRDQFIKKQTKCFMDTWNISDIDAHYLVMATMDRFKNKKLNTDKEFDVEYHEIVFPKHCPILGMELNYFATNYRVDNYPTFDRIDNNKGYVKGNVHVVSWRANRIKNDGSLEDFNKIVAFLNKIEEST